ncbi:MAG: glycosyltransferase family 4 protein [Gemmiger sp.]|nr:glycosyltransferase family 4 protein [Gemmiger sp.]
MKKLAFVIPWFSANISGGAEIALRDLTAHLHAAGVPLEILTTCVQSFGGDWGYNYFCPGTEEIGGITVRRFWADARAAAAFDDTNRKLMAGKPLTPEEETIYLNEMVNSDELYEYIRRHRQEYGLFVFIPYMFGTTYFGSAAAGDKAVLIPCFHDEPYAHIGLLAGRFAAVRGMAFLSAPEGAFAHAAYNLANTQTRVLGLGVDEIAGDAARFRKKFGITAPFVLYAGRKEAGKKVDLLLAHFAAYKAAHKSPTKLVMIGGGRIAVPAEIAADVLDLGFVAKQDKYDAYAAAAVLCQPSWFESFSLVIMESWLAGRPVLVSGQCAVTKHFAVESGGGLYFTNEAEFVLALDKLLQSPTLADTLGKNGQQYVRQHFNWDTVTQNYRDFFASLESHENNAGK